MSKVDIKGGLWEVKEVQYDDGSQEVISVSYYTTESEAHAAAKEMTDYYSPSCYYVGEVRKIA